MDIQYSPNSFSSFNIYSLSSEWIHHPLWGKRWTHWHQGCSAREDFRHREISSHATSSCQKCWFCFSKYFTDHELSRRNTKEISKVPRKGVWNLEKEFQGYLNATGAYVLNVKSGKLWAGVWKVIICHPTNFFSPGDLPCLGTVRSPESQSPSWGDPWQMCTIQLTRKY